MPLFSKIFKMTTSVMAFSFFLLIPVFSLWAASNVPYPDTWFGTQISSPQGFGSIIKNIMEFFASVVFAVSVFVFLYAGYLYMTAGDDEKAVEKAKSYLINGMIGVAIALLAWSIPQFVGSFFGASNILSYKHL